MPHRIRRDSAMPLDLYGDQAVYELELNQIWQRDWIFAAPVDAVAEPGDYLPVTIGDQPLILVRGDDYEIRAFTNACSHRGAALVDCPGRGTRIACPYHAWTYRSDGELLSVPYTLPDELDTSGLGLRSHRCETWHGLVFVNLDPGAKSLAETLEVVDPYVRPLAVSRLHHRLAGERSERWQANWKAIHANAIDSYSNFRLHAETIEPTSPTDGSYYLAGSAAATVTGGESFERADYVVIAIPPSFVAVVHSDAMVWHALSPQAADQTQVRIGYAAEHGSATGELPGWDAAHLEEDRRICEALQGNARVRREPGPLLGLERAIGDFHDFLRWRLTDLEPQAPFVAASPGERPDAGR